MQPRPLGKLLACLGLLVMFGAFAMDTSVSTGLGFRVANLHLLNEKSNLMLLGGALFLAGIVLLAANKLPENQERSPEASEAPLLKYAAEQARKAGRMRLHGGCANAPSGARCLYFIPQNAVPSREPSTK